MSKKGEIGIGTLIIFIAMILVAAISASVLIQTATSLQNKALFAGKRTQQQISSGIEALVIYGTDGEDGYVENFTMKVKLIAGSDTMRFNESMVEVMTGNTSVDYEYGGKDCDKINDTHFFIEHIIETTGHRDDYLQAGEVVMVCMKSPYPIGRDEDISFSVVSSNGFPLIIDTAMPEYLHTRRVFIFP